MGRRPALRTWSGSGPGRLRRVPFRPCARRLRADGADGSGSRSRSGTGSRAACTPSACAAAPAASAVAESSAGTEPLAPAVVQPELYVVWRRHGIGLERAAVRAIAGVFPRTPARGSPRGEEAAERLQGGPRGKEKDGYDQPA